jgi:hypothetical protein
MADEAHLGAALDAHIALPRADRRAIEALLSDRERLMVRELLRRHKQSGHLAGGTSTLAGTTNRALVGLSTRLARHVATLTDSSGQVVAAGLSEPASLALQTALDRRAGAPGKPSNEPLDALVASAKRWWQGLWS